MTLGIRLVKTSSEVHVSWYGNQLRSNTITEAWAGAREVFGELWTKDTVMVDTERMNEDKDLRSQPLLTPIKKLRFQEKGSILKPFKHSRKKG